MTTVEIHTTLNACNKTLRSVYPNIRIKTECAEDKNQNVFYCILYSSDRTNVF